MFSSGTFRTKSPHVSGSNSSRKRRPRRPDDGIHYRNRAITLIKLCQGVSEREIGNIRSYSALLDAKAQCDRAITFAIDARNETTGDADHQFEIAIKDLKTYNRIYFPLNNTPMDKHMKDATKDDDELMKPKTLRNLLKKVGDSPQRNVQISIHIFNTLADPSPIIVRQILGSSVGSSLPAEIVWNFGHFDDDDKRRLTLAQNPHFYTRLYNLPSAYGDNFTGQSTFEYDERTKVIYVLTNNSHGVLLGCITTPVILDNFWVTNNIIIVRDTGGNLLGQSIVTKLIQAEELYWNCIESLESPPAAESINDWSEPIRQLCQTSNAHDTHKFHALARVPMTLRMLG